LTRCKLFFTLLCAAGCGAPDTLPDAAVLPIPARATLAGGWALRSSREVLVPDSVVATRGFATDGWVRTRVPSTVVASLVDAGVFPDPYPGMSLRSLPGMDYPIGEPFFRYPMSPDSPFAAPWWYRVEFDLPAATDGRSVWLRFDGINERADVWLNGSRLADARATAGAFRTFDFDVTGRVRPSGNVLALKVAAPLPEDLTWNFVDWNPFPPDKSMGLTGDVTLSVTGPVRLRAPFVATHLGSLTRALLTVTVEAENEGSFAGSATVRGDIEGHAFATTVELAPHEVRKIVFAPPDFPSLAIDQPRLWWPATLGEPNLYTMSMSVDAGGARSDEASLTFGIREVTSELTGEGHRLFRVNGQRLLVRGAGWAPDLLLRHPAARMEDEIRYVRDMHLDAIRLEGKLGLEPLLDLCDRQGVLVIAGVCCCDRWEMFSYWNDENRQVAVASLADQARRMRAHPSLLAWLNGSDAFPPPDVEQSYLDAFHAADWPNPIVPSANSAVTAHGGPSGMKMPGPYGWVPPIFWYRDRFGGGAFGFNSETSIGSAIPPPDSLARFLPPDHRWPIDDVWTFHSVGGAQTDLFGLVPALEARYGPAGDGADFNRKAQLDAYEGVRAMFEAYGRNRYTATGVIHWMLNNGWPGLMWHLYDYYLAPAGGYFGAKKACEPLHVQYSYDDRSVVVVNAARAAAAGLTVRAEAWDLAGALRDAREAPLDLAADAAATAFVLPDPAGVQGAYLARLLLRDGAGSLRSENWYWLSTTPDLVDDGAPGTPSALTRYADYRALAGMGAATVEAGARVAHDGDDDLVTVSMNHEGGPAAFFVRATVALGPGSEVLPVRWDDNYVSLPPGGQRTIQARYRHADLGGAAPSVRIEGWNVAPAAVPLAR
jgi:exo-1,4-beta-D-glucosaminidase